MRYVTDRTTGLSLGRPENWHRVQPSAFDLVMVLEDPTRPHGVFQPNAVATVVPVPEAATLMSFTESTTTAWLAATPVGHVVAVDYYPAGGIDGRRIISNYDEQGIGVTMASFCFVHSGLATRVDVSFGLWNTAEGMRDSDYIMQSFGAPKAFAEASALDTGDRVGMLPFLKGLISRGR